MTKDELKKEDIPVSESAETTVPATDEGTTEIPPPAGEDIPPVHPYAERLSKAYPDRKFEKPEDYDAALNEHLDGLEGYKERGQLANQKLIALFQSEPQVGEICRDMIAGATFREALARHVSPDDLQAVEGDPDYEGWNKNKTAREESLAKSQADEDEVNKNLEISKGEIEAFAAENNLDEEGVQTFLGKIDDLVANVKRGKISKSDLQNMKIALDHDGDLVKATEQGVIAGRNQKIVAQKEEAKNTGDGLPKIAQSSGLPETKTPPTDYMSDLVNRTNKKKYL
jgi:hypothetical protein